jgi:hypothetical protein
MAAAMAAWFEAKIRHGPPVDDEPTTRESRGLGRFLRAGARGRRRE